MEEGGSVTLTVRDENGKVASAVVRMDEVSSLARLRSALSYSGLTFESKFALGYEHPEYGAYLMVCRLEIRKLRIMPLEVILFNIQECQIVFLFKLHLSLIFDSFKTILKREKPVETSFEMSLIVI
jgi:hypothetical protein